MKVFGGSGEVWFTFYREANINGDPVDPHPRLEYRRRTTANSDRRDASAFFRFGFAYVPVFGGNLPGGSTLIPYWFPTVLSMALPLAWIVRRRLRRLPYGRCANCGYDLRATPCAECGTRPATAE
jgi:hypothetical protein